MLLWIRFLDVQHLASYQPIDKQRPSKLQISIFIMPMRM